MTAVDRKGSLLLALAVTLVACGTPPPVRTPAAPPASVVSPVAVEQELERTSSGRSFWPGFDPLVIPLALYDGQVTWLFRHPHPPPEFGPGQGGARIADGRPEALRANTGAEIGGVPTATLILTSSHSARDWAAVAVHEAFHVFARQHHPGWSGDEMELFVYPLEAREPLILRREETQALRRALAAGDPESAACWADAAVRLRGQRFAVLPKEAAAYERGTELNEGLAAYVEGVARGETRMELPADDFPVEKVRDRAYAVGRAEALLLDRLDPVWKERLGKEGQPGTLDEQLAAATAGRAGSKPCALSSGETAAASRRAGEDLERLTRERQSARVAFLGRSGWTVVVLAEGAPLWPQRFDPLNVLRLGEGEVLHRRWLKLGNGEAELEVLDRDALTEAVGPHPLLQGVRRLTVTGLVEKPEVHERAGWARLDAPGFTAKLKSATIEVSGHELRIMLKGAPASHSPAPQPPAAAAAPHREPKRPTSTG
ncbi:MAG: hypothetical protein QOJ16_118 [Acidobacteriota bacterium]|nr:hypothetical protein [Acidobacteriota bacterium]